MPNRPNYQAIALLLHRVRVLVREQFQDIFRRFDLSEQQLRIMRVLNEHGELGITELADRCLISRPSIVGIIRRMEHLEYIRRKTDKNDKRKINIKLSKKGEELIAEIIPMLAICYGRIEEIVGKNRLERLYKILNEVADRMGPHEVRPNLNNWDDF